MNLDTNRGIRTQGSRQFTPPAPGDWVLVIDEVALGLPAPGSRRLTDMN